MIISFSVFKEKILDGTKTQTIRRYSEFQFKRFCNAKKYQLYWGNPRNGGELIREVEPAEPPRMFSFRDATLGEIEELSILDGFDCPAKMLDWFEERYGEDMFTKKFMVLRWKP